MKKIGVFYSFNTQKTKQNAKKIIKALGENNIEELNIEDVPASKFMEFENYILGVPTWWDGELPNYWDEFIPAIEDEGLKGKTFAIYGMGDQKGYSENFVDGIGIMANFLEARGAKIIGFTSIEGYQYEGSAAQRGNQFTGLALDVENQAALSEERINNWAKQLLKEFK